MLRLLVSAIAGMFLLCAPAEAQEKGAARAGFSAETLRGQKIVLLRPDVWVGSQSTAGMGEPNGTGRNKRAGCST